MNKRIYAGTTLMIIISSILIEIKSYNTVFIRIKIAIILLTFILIGISSYIKLEKNGKICNDRRNSQNVRLVPSKQAVFVIHIVVLEII